MDEQFLNQAYIAIKPDGYVDGACFAESADARDWCRQMERDGCVVKVCSRRRAKQVLGEYLSAGEMAALSDAAIRPSLKIHDGARIVAVGPRIGRYMDRDIPAWIETADGARHEYVGTSGPEVDLSTLCDGQSVIAPGLIYQRV